MWVIVKFEESWLYKLPYFLSSLSTHLCTSPRGLCFLTFIPGILKSTGKQLRIHKQAASQWQSSMPSYSYGPVMWQPVSVVSFWHPRKCKWWSSQRPLSPVRWLTAKVCLSLCAFTLGETLREFLRSGHVPRRHLTIHDRISLPNASPWYPIGTVFRKPAS